MRLAGATAILRLLTTTCNFLTRSQYRLPAILALGPSETLRCLLINKEFATLDAAASKNLKYPFVKLDIIDWTGQLIVPEVTGTPMIIKTTGATQFAVFQYSHTGICQTADLAFLCAMGGDLHNGSSCDLVGSKHPKLNAYDRLCLRTMRKVRHI
jgi:hypothetical protein